MVVGEFTQDTDVLVIGGGPGGSGERAPGGLGLSEELAFASDVEERALETEQIVLTHYAPQLIMRPKVFVNREYAVDLWAGRARAGHRVDGIILQRKDAPYTCGTAREGAAFKWKDHPTVDLAGSRLLNREGNPLPKEMCGKAVCVGMSKIEVESERDVLEYSVEEKGGSVHFFAIRRGCEKATPNGGVVVEATVRDALSAIQPHEMAGRAPFAPEEPCLVMS